jgi:hypothetical protein
MDEVAGFLDGFAGSITKKILLNAPRVSAFGTSSEVKPYPFDSCHGHRSHWRGRHGCCLASARVLQNLRYFR